MHVQKVDLVLLDHDMPNGNGHNLIHWMASTGRQNVPVLTFSGIHENNVRMMAFGQASGMTSMHPRSSRPLTRYHYGIWSRSSRRSGS